MQVPDNARPAFEAFLDDNLIRWSNVPSPAQNPGTIALELFHNDYHYILRVCLIGRYLHQLTGCRILAVIGSGDWMAPQLYQPQHIADLVRSFGPCDIELVDVDDLRNRYRPDAADDEIIAQIASLPLDQAQSRLLQLEDEDAVPFGKHLVSHFIRFRHMGFDHAVLRRTYLNAQSIRLHLKQLFARYDIRHVVTGHPTFLPYGLFTELGIRMGACVHQFNFQLGDLSVYFLNKANTEPGLRSTGLVNAALKDIDRTEFDRLVWPNRERLDQLAQSTFQLATSPSLQKPWWWNRGKMDIGGEEQHEGLAKEIASMRQGRKVVCLFAQLSLESMHLDQFFFDNPVDWMESVLRFALQDDAHVWLFKPHPLTRSYGDISLIDDFRKRFAAPHIHFLPENVNGAHIDGICDIGLTVCGTVGYILPSKGIPVLHAGHTAYTLLGFSSVPTSRDDYMKALSRLDDLCITDEQQERARLYYLYRKSITFVASTFLGPYQQFYDAQPRDHEVFWQRMSAKIKTYTPEDDSLYRNYTRSMAAGLGRLINHEYLDLVTLPAQTKSRQTCFS